MYKNVHAQVRKWIGEERDRITDENFFTDQVLEEHLANIAEAATSRYQYNRKPKVLLYYSPNNPGIGCTDNHVIHINTGSLSLCEEKASRQNRYYAVLGVFGHEVGHMLYTNFRGIETYMKVVLTDDERWLSDLPVMGERDNANLEMMRVWLGKKEQKQKERLYDLWKKLVNIYEDGYIEYRVMSEFPGTLGQAVGNQREWMYSHSWSISDWLLKGTPDVALLQALLMYATFGKIDEGDTSSLNGFSANWYEVLPFVDLATSTPGIAHRIRAANYTILHCWDIFKPYIDVEESEGNVQGTTEIGSGGNAVDDTSLPTSANQVSSNREGQKSEPSNDMPNPRKAGSKNDDENKRVVDASTSQMVELDSSAGDNQECDSSSATSHFRSVRPKDVEEINRIVNSLVNQMAEEIAFERAERERERERQEEACQLNQGGNPVDIRVWRVPVKESVSVAEKEMIKECQTIAKQMLRPLKPILETRSGGKLKGQLMGKELDAQHLYRQDARIFARKMLPTESDLVVTILIDQSGSMRSDHRQDKTMWMALIVYSFCKEIGVPIQILGHNVIKSHGPCVVQIYAEFDDIDHNDLQRILSITSNGANRDGTALRYAGSMLAKRPESKKILFLLSDGRPSEYDSYEEAVSDIQDACKCLRKQRISLVAAAIGDDRPAIHEIYGNAFWDVTDLDRISQKLVSQIKKVINM